MEETCKDLQSISLSVLYCGHQKIFQIPVNITLPNNAVKSDDPGGLFGTKNLFCGYRILTKGDNKINMTFTKNVCLIINF